MPTIAPPASPVSRAPSTEVARAAAFLDRLFPCPRSFDLRLWDGTVLSGGGEPRFTLVFASAAALRRMFRPPVEASLGTAYLTGDLEVEGDVCAVMSVVEACKRAARSPRQVAALARLWAALPSGGAAAVPAPGPALPGARHSPDRDRAAVRHHYDLGNDFFALFLDRRMVYSCAYFPTGAEDLEAAQELKLEHICRKLRLRPGERLLDVGCGWGALLIHAATRHGVSGVGITLSPRQQELAARRVAEAGLSDRVEIRVADYRELGSEVFDKVASVGMFEHVGRARLPEYFTRVYAALRPGGLFLNHGISRAAVRHDLVSVLTHPLNRLLVGRSPMTRLVFPDTELVPLSEVNLAAEQVEFEVRDVENLREHYALTLRHWIARLDEHRDEAARLVGAATVRAWRIYFAATVDRFETGRINVNQTLLARLDGGRARVPWSRADLYA